MSPSPPITTVYFILFQSPLKVLSAYLMEFYSHVFKCTSLPSLWLMAFYLLPATAPQGVLYPFALHISICECFESLHGWIHTFWRSGQVKCSQKLCNQVFIRDLRQEGVYVAVFWIVLQLLLSATIFCLDGNISGTLDVHFFLVLWPLKAALTNSQNPMQSFINAWASITK